MCSGVLVAERELMQALGYKDDKRFEAVARVKVANVKDSTIECPQDGALLKAVKYLDTELDVCPKCHALWLDHGEYEKVFRRVDDEVRKLRPEAKVKVEYVEAPTTFDDVLGFLRGTLDWAWIWRKLL